MNRCDAVDPTYSFSRQRGFELRNLIQCQNIFVCGYPQTLGQCFGKTFVEEVAECMAVTVGDVVKEGCTNLQADAVF